MSSFIVITEIILFYTNYSKMNGEKKLDYKELDVKIPEESKNYEVMSEKALNKINKMVQRKFDSDDHSIILDTNILGTFPLDNINKLAAPLIEAWAANIFKEVVEIENNEFSLINVEVGTKRTDLADIILQFKFNDTDYATSNIDVKSTTDTIKKSGKSPNITSFAKIRSAYLEDPDFMFIILSVRYHPYSETNLETGFAKGVIDLSDFHSYDFKYLSENDFTINPALGTGQVQIKDIHYINIEKRSTWKLIRILDDKYIHSSRRTFDDWKKEAQKNKWIK